jgi:hypothetical protein
MGDRGVEEGQGRAAAYWFGHLDRARAEGMSRKAYAEQSGLRVHRLYFWSARRRARATAAPPASGLFARAEIREALPGARTASQRLHLPGGAVLAWEGAADLALIDPLLGR